MKWLFQSTHPHGVRRDHRHQQHAVKMFQSTHPHGGRRRYLITNVFFLVFQSTHPHGVRREDATPTTMNWQSFNPRTLTGCDRKKIPGPSKQRSFNPRTLTGCDSTGHYQQCRRDVSIHAPSRGATGIKPPVTEEIDVSIHAPSRGATRRCKRVGNFR